MKKFLILVCCTFVLAGANLNAETKTKDGVAISGAEKIEITDAVTFNPCTLEPMLFSAVLEVITTGVITDKRIVANSKRIIHSIRATGLSTGTVYRGMQVTAQNSSSSGFNGSSVLFERIEATVISQGNQPNGKVVIQLRTVINADGTVTSTVDTFDLECR